MKILTRIKSAIAIGSLALTLFLGLQSIQPAVAVAASSQSSFLAATASQLDARAKSDLNKVAGAGASDKLEGYVDQATGTLEKEMGNAATSLEGTALQVQGKAKVGVGQVKGAIEDATDAAEDAGDSLMDTVKDFFE